MITHYYYLLQSDAFDSIDEDAWYSIQRKEKQYTIYNGDQEHPFVVKAIYHWIISNFDGDQILQ